MGPVRTGRSLDMIGGSIAPPPWETGSKSRVLAVGVERAEAARPGGSWEGSKLGSSTAKTGLKYSRTLRWLVSFDCSVTDASTWRKQKGQDDAISNPIKITGGKQWGRGSAGSDQAPGSGRSVLCSVPQASFRSVSCDGKEKGYRQERRDRQMNSTS